MKKTLIPLLLGLILAGCSNDEPNELFETDYSPTEVTIYVQDTDGDDLFSDAYNGILDSENLPATVTYTYDGETKPLSERRRPVEAKTPQSRYYMPRFYGVFVDYK